MDYFNEEGFKDDMEWAWKLFDDKYTLLFSIFFSCKFFFFFLKKKSLETEMNGNTNKAGLEFKSVSETATDESFFSPNSLRSFDFSPNWTDEKQSPQL